MAEEKNSKTIEKIVEDVSKLSVLELSELVNALQDKLGVSAMVSPAPAGAGPMADEGEKEATDEGGNKTVVITAAGDNKIAVIKAIRAIDPNLGLKDAKDMTEALPAEVAKDVKAQEAKEFEAKLKEAGATVELK